MRDAVAVVAAGVAAIDVAALVAVAAAAVVGGGGGCGDSDAGVAASFGGASGHALVMGWCGACGGSRTSQTQNRLAGLPEADNG